MNLRSLLAMVSGESFPHGGRGGRNSEADLKHMDSLFYREGMSLNQVRDSAAPSSEHPRSPLHAPMLRSASSSRRSLSRIEAVA
jgi:hypothetical protein